MIRAFRSWASHRALLGVRWWLTGKRAHKLTTIGGVDHHLGSGVFRGGYVSYDPETRALVGLVMLWLPDWSVDIDGFEKIALSTVRKHPTLNEVTFYVPS